MVRPISLSTKILVNYAPAGSAKNTLAYPFVTRGEPVASEQRNGSAPVCGGCVPYAYGAISLRTLSLSQSSNSATCVSERVAMPSTVSSRRTTSA